MTTVMMTVMVVDYDGDYDDDDGGGGDGDDDDGDDGDDDDDGGDPSSSLERVTRSGAPVSTQPYRPLMRPNAQSIKNHHLLKPHPKGQVVQIAWTARTAKTALTSSIARTRGEVSWW